MHYRRNPRTAWQSIGDVTVVINLTTNCMIGLNDSAGYLWKCLENAVDPTAVAGHLSSAGTIGDREAAASVIAQFLERLVEHGLAETSPVAAVKEVALPAPPERFETPIVVWTEELRSVAFTCAKIGGQSGACNASPTA